MTCLSVLKAKYPTAEISQIGSKELFLVEHTEFAESYLVSYLTVIGIKVKGIWRFSTKRYSNTSTKHLNFFKKQLNSWEKFVDIDNLEEHL